MPDFQFYGAYPDGLILKMDNGRQMYEQNSLAFYKSNDVCKKILGRNKKDVSLEI